MTQRTLNYGNYGIFLIMGNAGFYPSTTILGVPCYDCSRMGHQNPAPIFKAPTVARPQEPTEQQKAEPVRKKDTWLPERFL